jgi:hypothetical protein
MLEKTFNLLADVPLATYVDESYRCYDEQEIAELGSVLSRLVYAPSQLRKRIQELGATIVRSDFYSEIPGIADVEITFKEQTNLYLDEIFQEKEFLLTFLNELDVFASEFSPPKEKKNEHEFAWNNNMFSLSDAMAYYCMIRYLKPPTIVEVGSGTSSLIALQAIKQNGFGRLVCIEPFAQPFLKTMPGVELIEQRAQDLALDYLNSLLLDGSFLFIDTTHTVRHNSDCLHIYLRLLPFIKSKIIVHAHDIWLPNTLPLDMLRDKQINWNEQYLLYAYLLRNRTTRVLYGSNYHYRHNRERLDSFMNGKAASGGGSMWFSQEIYGT